MVNIRDYEAMAKLKLPDNEHNWIESQAEMLINSFSELEKIDTNNIEPMITVLNLQNILREDISSKMLTREQLLSNAPEQYDGYVQVPRTLD